MDPKEKRSFEEGFTRFVRAQADCTVLDDSPRPVGKECADYALFRGQVVAELKCLDDDLQSRIQELTDEECRRRGIVFYGELLFDQRNRARNMICIRTMLT